MKNILVVAAAAAVMATAAYAEDTKTNDVSLTLGFDGGSDYIFRGESLTNGGAFGRAGAKLGFGAAYVSGSVASVNFGGASERYEAEAGLNGSYHGLGLNGGVRFVSMPQALASGNSYLEGFAGASYDVGFATLRGSVAYSDDYLGSIDSFWYPTLGVDVPTDFLPWAPVTFYAEVGKSYYDNSPDSIDWGAGARTTIGPLNAAVEYRESDDRVFALSNKGDGTVVFKIGTNFSL